MECIEFVAFEVMKVKYDKGTISLIILLYLPQLYPMDTMKHLLQTVLKLFCFQVRCYGVTIWKR